MTRIHEHNSSEFSQFRSDIAELPNKKKKSRGTEFSGNEFIVRRVVIKDQHGNRVPGYFVRKDPLILRTYNLLPNTDGQIFAKEPLYYRIKTTTPNWQRDQKIIIQAANQQTETTYNRMAKIKKINQLKEGHQFNAKITKLYSFALV